MLFSYKSFIGYTIDGKNYVYEKGENEIPEENEYFRENIIAPNLDIAKLVYRCDVKFYKNTYSRIKNLWIF